MKAFKKSVGKGKPERGRTEDIEVVEEWAIYKVGKRMIVPKQAPALTHVKKVDVILSSP